MSAEHPPDVTPNKILTTTVRVLVLGGAADCRSKGCRARLGARLRAWVRVVWGLGVGCLVGVGFGVCVCLVWFVVCGGVGWTVGVWGLGVWLDGWDGWDGWNWGVRTALV